MSDKCKASYKNLNRIKSYSEQAYATVQWAQQACMNDEWLRQQVEKLSYLTPPAVRKRFAPVLVDDLQSYGHNVVGTDVFFSNSTDEEINIDFQDMGLIDLNKSDCAFDTYMDNGETFIQARVPIKTVSSTDTSVKNHDGGGTNSYWYVGFDKNKNYQLRPDWINDHLDHEIPSVCRAQTITIPNDFLSNGQTGKLVSVDLQIENNGTTASNWGSPLIVQVFKTQLKHVEKTWWSKSEKKNKSHDMKIYTGLWDILIMHWLLVNSNPIKPIHVGKIFYLTKQLKLKMETILPLSCYLPFHIGSIAQELGAGGVIVQKQKT